MQLELSENSPSYGDRDKGRVHVNLPVFRDSTRFGNLARFAEFGRFLISGGTAAAMNFGSAWVLRSFLPQMQMIFEVSVVAGFTLGTFTSFLLNRSFTFKVQSGNVLAEFARFNALGLVLGIVAGFVARAFSLLLQPIPFLVDNQSALNVVAHIATIGVMTLVNFWLIKHIVFTKRDTGSSSSIMSCEPDPTKASVSL